MQRLGLGLVILSWVTVLVIIILEQIRRVDSAVVYAAAVGMISGFVLILIGRILARPQPARETSSYPGTVAVQYVVGALLTAVSAVVLVLLTGGFLRLQSEVFVVTLSVIALLGGLAALLRARQLQMRNTAQNSKG